MASKYTQDQRDTLERDKHSMTLMVQYINENSHILSPKNAGGQGIEFRCPCSGCGNKVFAFYGERYAKPMIISHNSKCSDFAEYNDIYALMAAVKFGHVDKRTCAQAMDEHIGYVKADPSKYYKHKEISSNASTVSLISTQEASAVDSENIKICDEIFASPMTAAETALIDKAYKQRGLSYKELPADTKENVRYVSELHIKAKSTGKLRKTPINGVMFRTGPENNHTYEVRCTDSKGVFISKAMEEQSRSENSYSQVRRFEAIGPKTISGFNDIAKTKGPLHLFEGRFNEHTAKICGCDRAVSMGGAGVNLRDFASEIKEHNTVNDLVFIDYDSDETGLKKGRELASELNNETDTRRVFAVQYSPVPAGYNDLNDFFKDNPERAVKRIKTIPDKLDELFLNHKITLEDAKFVSAQLSQQTGPNAENVIIKALELVQEHTNSRSITQ